LERDHQYLLQGGVFTEEQIETWIALKRQEARALYDMPHPYEYTLYYDT
jgi:glutamine synthetase